MLGIQHGKLSIAIVLIYLLMAYVNLIATGIVFDIRVSGSYIGLMMAFLDHRRRIISVFNHRYIMNCLYWHNQEVSLPLWQIRPQWFHTFSPCGELLGNGHEGIWARFGSHALIAWNWHWRSDGTRYSGTSLYQKSSFLSIVKYFGAWHKYIYSVHIVCQH